MISDRTLNSFGACDQPLVLTADQLLHDLLRLGPAVPRVVHKLDAIPGHSVQERKRGDQHSHHGSLPRETTADSRLDGAGDTARRAACSRYAYTARKYHNSNRR